MRKGLGFLAYSCLQFNQFKMKTKEEYRVKKLEEIVISIIYGYNG
jgi:hypothetical protein